MASPAASDPARGRWNDDAVERFLGRLLQAGVLLAMVLVAAGGVRYLAREGLTVPSYGQFVGEPEELSHVGGIVRAALAGRARGLIQLGLLVLIATPVLRVACSLVAFLLQRDRTYTLLTAFVLLLLIASLLGVAP